MSKDKGPANAPAIDRARVLELRRRDPENATTLLLAEEIEKLLSPDSNEQAEGA